jgi:long-chain acyl-CoA synthetase
MTATTTLPKLLRRNADTMPKRPAIREKRQGIWQTFNWAQHYARVQAVARGLAVHGFRRGHRLAVLGDNRPTLYWALLAAQALGGVGVPAWPDADADWLAAVLGEADVSIAVAEDDDQVAMLLSICHQLPKLALIISCAPVGEHLQNRAPTRTFDAIVADGESTTIDVAAEIAQGQPGDPALLLYTTTDSGQPRGVLLSHANLIGAAKALSAAEDFRPTDDCLSFLPMAWIGDALYSTALGLLIGFTCNCPEDPETARRDLRELGPTILLAPPRIWESLLNEIDTKATQATPLKRRLYNHFRRLAESGTPSGLHRLFGELLIYSPVRDQIGLGRMRWAHVGGGTLAPSLARLLRGFGINLKQIYGPAELSGIVALGPGEPAGVAGPACPGVEVRIAQDGEVHVRSPGVCIGYFFNEPATRAALTDDGWWRTGDSGRIDGQGNLIVTGRLSDVVQSDDGTSFAPHEIEIALRGSRFVADVVVPARTGWQIAAMIVVDATAAGNWARGNGVAYTTMAELIATPALRKLLRDEVRAYTAMLPPTLRVRRVALLESGAAIGTEAGLSRDRQRRALLDANAALADALFRHDHAAGAWVIEDLDCEVRVVQEPAHA